MKISMRVINAFLRRKGIDPKELMAAKKMKIKLGRGHCQKINTRLNDIGLVVIRRTTSGDSFEFVNPKYVKISPRFHFEKSTKTTLV